MAEFSKSGNVYPLSIENWLNIIKPGGNEDFLSDNDYWRVIQALKEHGFFYKNEIPEDMQAVEAAPGIPVLTPVFFDDPPVIHS
ncbi:MAG: hypothetical protein IJR35_11665 [Synergistaceae bacterium]|nr:hypothetical protein [Synergistaceae bacterium]